MNNKEFSVSIKNKLELRWLRNKYKDKLFLDYDDDYYYPTKVIIKNDVITGFGETKKHYDSILDMIDNIHEEIPWGKTAKEHRITAIFKANLRIELLSALWSIGKKTVNERNNGEIELIDALSKAINNTINEF